MNGERLAAYRVAARYGWLPIEAIMEMPPIDRVEAWRYGLALGRFTVNQIRAAEGVAPLGANR